MGAFMTSGKQGGPIPGAAEGISGLVRVAHLAMHLEGHLAELDINPLTVLPPGRGVKAVDALVVFRGT